MELFANLLLPFGEFVKLRIGITAGAVVPLSMLPLGVPSPAKFPYALANIVVSSFGILKHDSTHSF